jgi:signal transduction histidine kinase
LADRESEVILFRLIEEAVENVVRHGNATTCAISLTGRDAATGQVEIRDNGIGLPKKTARTSPPSLGLLHMRERASMLGGRLTVRSKPFYGTTVSLTLPLTRAS